LPRRVAHAAAAPRRRHHAGSAGDVSAEEVSGMEPRKNARASHTLDKTIHHPLLAGFVELDRELVAVDRRDVAVAELLVKDAVADRELGDGASRLGDELA